MKRWILLMLSVVSIFLLASCDQFDISKILFIASVGVEKKDDELQGYFYLPLSSDIGKSENGENKGQGQFAKTSGKTIPELFDNIQSATSLTINFRHVSSIVLNVELYNKEFIEELIDFIKYSLDIDFNCYMFATEEKLEEIYDFKNPNEESVLTSLLVSTSDASSLYLVAPPLHFLKFARDYFKERSILIPLLVLEEIWTIESKETKSFHAQSALIYFKDEQMLVIEDPSSPYFLTLSQFSDDMDQVPILFTDYSFKADFKEQLYLEASFKYEIYKSDSKISRKEIEDFVKKRITDYLKQYEKVDPLNIAYFNYVYGTNCSYDKVDIKVNIKNN